MRARVACSVLVAVVAGCRTAPPPREHLVVGQILRVDLVERQVTLRHEDVVGFMPAMTMTFRVKEPVRLDGRRAGELVDATLSVQGTDAWISRLAVTGVAPLPRASDVPVQGLTPGDLVPDATFTDQDGHALRLRALDGRAAVISFVYTRCQLPDYCPAVESRLAHLQQLVRTDPRLNGTQIVAVTLDPGYDTPAVLKAHAIERGADPAIWRFVTGSRGEVDAFGRQFGLSVTRGSGAPADIEHNLRTIVLDRGGRIVHVETGGAWLVDDLSAALHRAADGS
jgi:protein SCO1/2